MKRILVLLSVVVLAYGANAAWSYNSSAKTITDGTWVLNAAAISSGLELGTSEAAGSGFNSANAGSGILDLTSFYEDTGYRIVSIRKNALRGKTSPITQFIAPDVVSVGDYAFTDSSSLVNISISQDVSSIKPSAFSGCKLLANIYPRVFNNLTVVPANLFSNCSSLEGELSFPNATSVGNDAFNATTKLGRIVLNSSITSFGSQCFLKSGITNLVPESYPNLTTIGSAAFNNASNLKGNFSFPSLTALGAQNTFVKAANIESVSIPNVKDIPRASFQECRKLKFVEFHPGCTNIGVNAFNGCSVLERITAYIPDSCEAIGSTAFTYCYKLAMPLRIANPAITNLTAELFRETAGAFSGPAEFYSPIAVVGSGCFRGTKRAQIYRFYGNKAPESFNKGAFDFALTPTPGVTSGIGVYIQVMKKSALEGWRAYCDSAYADNLSTLIGYPGKKAIGVFVRSYGSRSNYNWIVDCAPPAGTMITIL